MNSFKDFMNIKSDSKDDPASERILEVLENIDDDCDRNGIILVNKLKNWLPFRFTFKYFCDT